MSDLLMFNLENVSIIFLQDCYLSARFLSFGNFISHLVRWTTKMSKAARKMKDFARQTQKDAKREFGINFIV